MTIVVPFCASDAHLAINLLGWIKQLGTHPEHSCLLVVDAAVDWGMSVDVLNLANEIFRSTSLITNDKPTEGWIPGSNSLFRAAAIHMESASEPFLWIEPDGVPLVKDWLEKIVKAYQQCGKPFMGSLVNHTNANRPNPYFEGCGVYPADTWSRIKNLFIMDESWTLWCADAVVPHAVNSTLFQHFWGVKDLAPTFVASKKPDSPVNTLTSKDIHPDAVFFHRCKDGSLMRLLKTRAIPHQKADVVSLRRAGDIINLLPLLYRMAEDLKRPVKLVVAKEFMPLLDGVSYVEGIEWGGDWEDPLAAVRHHGGKNAQVFGKGLHPPMQSHNFAKFAWEQVGYEWERHWPLVFDRRNKYREHRLLPNDDIKKPLVLVKLRGLSSPCGEADWIRQQLFQTYRECTFVMLDNIQAERIYDFLGMMDDAACLLTVDTSLLHLAHASKVPTIALVNGGGWSASPPRGNCILRVPYSEIIRQWPKIEQLIDVCITPIHSTPGQVLVYSQFRSNNPNTQRRMDTAYATWPLLHARLFPFNGPRTSAIFRDQRSVPFIHDMIEEALRTGNENIVIITNNDIKVDVRLIDSIHRACQRVGCWWAYRVEHPNSPTDQGADLFAFTRKWWSIHKHLLPDFLLGNPWWDDMLVRIMRWSGCNEQERLYYHEAHPGVMSGAMTLGWKHNERLALDWLDEWHEKRDKP